MSHERRENELNVPRHRYATGIARRTPPKSAIGPCDDPLRGLEVRHSTRSPRTSATFERFCQRPLRATRAHAGLVERVARRFPPARAYDLARDQLGSIRQIYLRSNRIVRGQETGDFLRCRIMRIVG